MRRFEPIVITALTLLAGVSAALGPSPRLPVATERLSVSCPGGTTRAVKLLRSDTMELRVGVEQPRWQVYCRDEAGIGHGPAVLVRHSYRYNSHQLRVRGFFLAGQLIWAGRLVGGLRDGRWRQFNRHGEVLGSNLLRSGDGSWRAWRSGGELAVRGQVRAGRRSGEWTYLFESGRPAAKGSYDRGRMVGRWRRWYPDGALRSDIGYKAGRRHGLTTEWHPGGEKRMEGRFVHGVRDGEWSFWSARGELLGINRLERDSGLWITWHDNGYKREEGRLVQGRREGRWFLYDELGRKTAEGDYRGGTRLTSTWIRYTPDGLPRRSGSRAARLLGRFRGRLGGAALGGRPRPGLRGALRRAISRVGGSGGAVGRLGRGAALNALLRPEVKVHVHAPAGWGIAPGDLKQTRLTLKLCAIAHELRRLPGATRPASARPRGSTGLDLRLSSRGIPTTVGIARRAPGFDAQWYRCIARIGRAMRFSAGPSTLPGTVRVDIEVR